MYCMEEKYIQTSWGWAGPSSVTDLLVHLPLWWFPCGHLTLSLSSHKNDFLWVGPLVWPTSCEIVFLCGHLPVRSALIFCNFWPFLSCGYEWKKPKLLQIAWNGEKWLKMKENQSWPHRKMTTKEDNFTESRQYKRTNSQEANLMGR